MLRPASQSKVGILLHGQAYAVDVERMRQSGPVDDTGMRPGREIVSRLKRTPNQTVLVCVYTHARAHTHTHTHTHVHK